MRLRCQRNRRRGWPRLGLGIALAVALLFGLMALGDRFTVPPRTQAEAEAQLDRSILAYALWEETPYVVFEVGGVVHFDRLVLDPVSIEWPPVPRWQWTGMWWTIDAATDPASGGIASTREQPATDPYRYASGGDAVDERDDQGRPVHPVIFGQVNAREIAWLDVQLDGQWSRYPVAFPGYAIRLPADAPIPEAYRFQDADGTVLWSMDAVTG